MFGVAPSSSGVFTMVLPNHITSSRLSPSSSATAFLLKISQNFVPKKRKPITHPPYSSPLKIFASEDTTECLNQQWINITWINFNWFEGGLAIFNSKKKQSRLRFLFSTNCAHNKSSHALLQLPSCFQQNTSTFFQPSTKDTNNHQLEGRLLHAKRQSKNNSISMLQHFQHPKP